MSTYPRTPYTLKCGIVLIDPLTRHAGRVIVLQYTPDHLSRTLQVQSVTGDTGDRTEPLRFKGPPVETFRLEADIDATDQHVFSWLMLQLENFVFEIGVNNSCFCVDAFERS